MSSVNENEPADARPAAIHELPTAGDGNYADLWGHHEVGTLVRRTKNYIVHISRETNRLDWETSRYQDLEREKLDEPQRALYHAIHCDVAVLESRPSSEFPLSVVTNFRLLLGEALVCAFEHDFATAKLMVASASQYIEARSQELARRWYLTACLASALPCAAIALVLWSMREHVISTHGAALFWMLLASMSGAIGALFSVLLRTGRLHLDCASGMWLHNLEGMSRILAGAISGIAVALMLKAELLIQFVLQPGKESYAIILLAMASGVSERFAVSLIEKFEKNQVDTKSVKKGEE